MTVQLGLKENWKQFTLLLVLCWLALLLTHWA